MQRFRRLSARGKVLAVAAILLVGSGAVLGAVRLGRRGPQVPTAEVKRGEFLDSLQFRGEVKARKSVTISAPSEAGNLQILKITPEGTRVKAGEMVVQFDGTKTEQELAQFKSALKSADAEVAQARAQARLAEEEDKTAVLKAHYDVETAKLEASKQEIVSRIEGEEARLKLADVEQKLREVEAKQKSDQQLHAATIKSKREASEKAKYDVERSDRALGQMMQRAPADGTISVLQHWTGSTMSAYRPGDHAWAGAAIAELPDVSTLRITARVDETERGRLAAQQPVTVRLNAIPDRQFTGHVDQISAIASLDFSSGWPITRNFLLEVALEQSDPRLKPGLTGEVIVVVDKVADAVTIPAQALFQKSGRNVAYVWRGGQFQERPVAVERRSGDKVLIARGITAGEQVALRDPTTKEQAQP
jgi:HlyD family secretion protein